MEPGSSISTGPAVPSLPTELQQTAPLDMIDESPFNPRKTFGGLTELGASLRERWLVPLIVRPHPKITGRYQLVDGARRYRAAKQAGIHNAPINLVHMSDQEVMIAQHVSYLREELPALEQAEGFKALLASGMKVEEIAKRIGGGVSKETVYARMKLLELVEPVKKALADGPLTAGHGVLIARLEPKMQERALKACLPTRGGESLGDDAVMSVRELDTWIEWEVRRQNRDAERKAERKKQPPRPASKPAVDYQAQRAKEEEKRNRERAVRRAIFDAALEGVKAPLERADLEFALTGLVERASDELLAAHGIDLKTHGYRGAQAALAKSTTAMKPQALGHLLIELSISEELDDKPERLLAFAKLHKVNVDKIRARVEAELKKSAAEKKLEAVGLLSTEGKSPAVGKLNTKVQPSAMKAGGGK